MDFIWSAGAVGVGGGGSGNNSLIYAGYTPTIYASTADIGTGSGANEANAMDLPTALSTATAGDIIGVLPGTYTGTNTSDRFSPAWRTTNSGTAGNLIRVVAKYAAAIYDTNLCDMRSGTTTDGAGCPAFGVHVKDYVEWIGFYVDEANSASRNDTGPVVCVGTTGSAIRLCHVIGDSAYTPDDNHDGIRAEGHYNCAITDNKIHGFKNNGTGGNNVANGCGICTYTGGNLTIQNNTIYDCYTAIHHKANGTAGSGATDSGKMGWFITSDNLCYNISYYGLILARSYSGYDRDTYRNVIVLDVPSSSNGFGLTYWNYTPDDPLRNRIQNNVIYVVTSAGGGCYGVYHKGQLGASNTFNGNIVVAADRAIYQEAVSTFTTSEWSGDRNCYHGYTTFGTITNGSGNPLSTYASTYGIDGNSINSNPSFTNPATRDFSLAGGSPCIDLARDVLNITGTGVNATVDAGAYPLGTETIGVRT